MHLQNRRGQKNIFFPRLSCFNSFLIGSPKLILEHLFQTGKLKCFSRFHPAFQNGQRQKSRLASAGNQMDTRQRYGFQLIQTLFQISFCFIRQCRHRQFLRRPESASSLVGPVNQRLPFLFLKKHKSRRIRRPKTQDVRTGSFNNPGGDRMPLFRSQSRGSHRQGRQRQRGKIKLLSGFLPFPGDRIGQNP